MYEALVRALLPPLLGMMACLCGLVPADAGTITIYETGFEAPQFSPGTPLAGQDGFVAYVGINADAAQVVAEAPSAGAQAVRIDVSSMTEEFIPGYYAGFYYRPVNYDPIASGTPRVTFEVSVRLDAGLDTLDPNAGVQLFDASGTYLAGLVVGTGPSEESDLPVGIFGDNNDLETISTLVGEVEFGTYYRLAVCLDYQARSIEFFVDNASLGMLPFSLENELTFGDADLFVSDRGPFATVGYFDEYVVTATSVPEPSSLILAVMGSLVLGGSLWRSREARLRR